eukprot:7233540-Pyramimonas_sp.AAC.1
MRKEPVTLYLLRTRRQQSAKVCSASAASRTHQQRARARGTSAGVIGQGEGDGAPVAPLSSPSTHWRPPRCAPKKRFGTR